MKKKLYLKNYFNRKTFKQNYKKSYSKTFEKLIKKINQDLDKSDNTLNIISKKFKFNLNFEELKKFKKYKSIVLIGMGGSILGSEAIYDFFKKKIKKKFHFFNNLDEDRIINFKKKNKLSEILFIIVSKSGNTVETLANIFSLDIIKKNAKNLIIISEKNNFLHKLSKKFNLFHIEHKHHIGGRYSVLSEVGLVPAYLMGLNISKFRSKLLDYLYGNDKKFLKDSSIYLSKLLNSKKYNNLILLNYSPELEKFLFWCQQLVAESLGKEKKGFLPVISNVPKDHHSLLQLYLDGPKDKIFYIFSCERKTKLKTNIKNSTDMYNFINKKKLSVIKSAQKNALVKALTKNKISFREFKINDNDEKTLGKIFSYFILETIIVGKLSGINPFDQPAVEQVKIFTKQFLSKKTKNNL